VHALRVRQSPHQWSPHKYPYTIYPCNQPQDCGFDSFGVTRLPVLLHRLKPDVIVILQDPWNIKEYLDQIRRIGLKNVPPIVAWLAVDAKNQQSAPVLNELAHVVVWTKFAADELRASGYTGTPSIVSLGVDTSIYYSRDRAKSRSLVCPPTLPPDAYLVGCVGRNQPRKRLDLTIAYFADWVTRYDVRNAYLYLHIAPTGDVGCDIRSLVRYYGLSGRVIIAETMLGMGHDENTMAHVYSALDCYLTTTQGEGWGLPALEAMACGVPCVVPDWSGLGADGWTRDAVIRVPCTSTALSAPLNGLAHTVGGIPDQRATAHSLQFLYKDASMREAYGSVGVKLAKSLSWHDTGDKFRAILESVVESCSTPAKIAEVASA
jgi:D-inositol-3-phosphate glycosyltransferase